jgi:hypothetical protein|tara:strand:- start:30 stop:290 length:261 start_codon:yes stop_codon:yes gene_type:complete
MKHIKSITEHINREVKEVDASSLNEGFETWLVSFEDMNLSGVKLRAENEYKVTARTTVEAIKKASKMAGLKGNDWMATVTNSIKKI